MPPPKFLENDAVIVVQGSNGANRIRDVRDDRDDDGEVADRSVQRRVVLQSRNENHNSNNNSETTTTSNNFDLKNRVVVIESIELLRKLPDNRNNNSNSAHRQQQVTKATSSTVFAPSLSDEARRLISFPSQSSSSSSPLFVGSDEDDDDAMFVSHFRERIKVCNQLLGDASQWNEIADAIGLSSSGSDSSSSSSPPSTSSRRSIREIIEEAQTLAVLLDVESVKAIAKRLIAVSEEKKAAAAAKAKKREQSSSSATAAAATDGIRVVSLKTLKKQLRQAQSSLDATLQAFEEQRRQRYRHDSIAELELYARGSLMEVQHAQETTRFLAETSLPSRVAALSNCFEANERAINKFIDDLMI